MLAAVQPLQESAISIALEHCIALSIEISLYTCVVEVCNACHTRSVLPQALDASVFCITHGFHQLKLTANSLKTALALQGHQYVDSLTLEGWRRQQKVFGNSLRSKQALTASWRVISKTRNSMISSARETGDESLDAGATRTVLGDSTLGLCRF